MTASSDGYFYWLGDRMDGTTDIQDTATKYGFDGATGIDLPNEATGFVFTPDEKKALHVKYPQAYPNDTTWYTGDSVQLAIGQNVVGVTPVQLVGAYGALANGGTVYQPHVVAQVLKPGSPTDVPIAGTDPANVVRVVDPVVRAQVSLPDGTRGPIVDGLTGVTRNGTAATAFQGFNQSNFAIVGKTGTAQVNGKADTSIFASYVRGTRSTRWPQCSRRAASVPTPPRPWCATSTSTSPVRTSPPSSPSSRGRRTDAAPLGWPRSPLTFRALPAASTVAPALVKSSSAFLAASASLKFNSTSTAWPLKGVAIWRMSAMKLLEPLARELKKSSENSRPFLGCPVAPSPNQGMKMANKTRKKVTRRMIPTVIFLLFMV